MAHFDSQNNAQKSAECEIAEAIAQEWRGLLYDTNSHSFIMLNPKTVTWFFLEDKQVTSLVRKFIYERPTYISRESTRAKFYGNGTDHLRYCVEKVVIPLPGIMTKDKFFNFQTCQGEPPSPDQFCFNYIDQPFDVLRPMEPKAINFISSLCNYDWVQVHILRHFVKCALLNQNPSQTILFLIGPGQTGKSTLAKLLMSLKNNTCCTLELHNLTE